MIVQEQHQFEVVGILVKVVGYLAAQGLVALDAAPGIDFLQQNVAIGKVEHSVERSHIVGLQIVLTEGLGVLCQKLVQPVLRLEVQLTSQLRTNAKSPYLAKDDNIAADGLQTVTKLFEETERLSQGMVDTEGVNTHAGKFFSLVNHKADHLGVCQIKLRQIAKAQERHELVAVFLRIEEPVAVLAAILQQRLFEDGCLIPTVVWHEVADNLHLPIVSLVEQLAVVVPRTQMRIHILEIQGVIAMIVGRLEDG